MVKNAVIVPVGSKGGFVLKARRPPSRPRGLPQGRRRLLPELPARPPRRDRQPGAAARSCRRRTSCATIPTIRTSWSPPTRARRPSPTTPTRSRAEYGFWLGDAFASGGSVGYDHKKMGITANGAWESVKRHFREMGIDTQSQDFTVVGRRRHVGRRVRQRHAAVAPHQAAWRRSTTATSSSTRTRIPRRASRSASACSTCRARRGTTTTSEAHLEGRRRLSAHARSRSPLSPEVRDGARHRGRRAHAAGAASRRSSRRRWTCSTTAASAPT